MGECQSELQEKEVASMWWAKTGYKVAYASIVGVWAVLMFVVFT